MNVPIDSCSTRHPQPFFSRGGGGGAEQSCLLKLRSNISIFILTQIYIIAPCLTANIK